MKFIIIHYNTPKLTTALIASLHKIGIYKDIVIFENSDKYPLNADEIFDDIFTYHNETGSIIDFNKEIHKFIEQNKISKAEISKEEHGAKFGSLKHALTVQWLLDNIDDDFFLLDSDILVKKDFRNLIDKGVLFTGETTQHRVLPFLIYFNINEIKNAGIKFCDFVNIHPNRRSLETDTGGSFLKECKNKHVIYRSITLSEYIEHYGSGSWRDPSINPNAFQGQYNRMSEMEFLRINKNLFI